ncbi:MAG: GNAT family N-acetyltransferase [Chloroflexota bacterium]|nr:GNAT family N-acetyltransferase [Chloroflexota bacterium]
MSIRGTRLLPEARFAGSNLIAIWYIGHCSLVQLDPAYIDPVKEVLRAAGQSAALSGDLLQAAWGAERIQARDWGLAHYLYPADLPDVSPARAFTLRQLTVDDAAAMGALHEANTPEDVDEGYVEVTHPIAFGCFAGDQLVAAASGYERTGFLDVGVLTHPAFRGQGLGTAVVGALCHWSIAQDLIAQYRCDAKNLASQRVAQALNFTLYFRQESVSLH